MAAMVQWYIGLATLRMLRRSRVRVRVRNRWAKNTCPHQAPMSRRAHVGGLPWHYCHMHMRNVWIQAGCQTGDWVVRVATCAQEPVVACTCRLPSPPQAHYHYYYYYIATHGGCQVTHLAGVAPWGCTGRNAPNTKLQRNNKQCNASMRISRTCT